MLNVNTIEFNGRKAVINSFSDHPLMVDSMNNQLDRWTKMFPKATVRLERMSELQTMELVAAHKNEREAAWNIGRESEK